ncbi:hypothetical protein W03_15240 [Nitrosomonas sp. PY1]|nr:hypothetical protein W03_15240 [Nitrosomonas sp. PY1]
MTVGTNKKVINIDNATGITITRAQYINANTKAILINIEINEYDVSDLTKDNFIMIVSLYSELHRVRDYNKNTKKF